MARQTHVPADQRSVVFRGRQWNLISWFYAVMLVLLAIITGATAVLHGINTMLDAADGQVTLSVEAHDPSATAGLAPTPPSGATAHILSATIGVDPTSLTPLANTLILAGTWCWIIAGLLLLVPVAIVGWRLFEGTLVSVPRRPIAWLATGAVATGALAALVEIMGANTALRDLGYATPTLDVGYVAHTVAFSSWIWIAVLWVIIFLGQAWRTVNVLAEDAQGLV